MKLSSKQCEELVILIENFYVGVKDENLREEIRKLQYMWDRNDNDIMSITVAENILAWHKRHQLGVAPLNSSLTDSKGDDLK